MPSRTALRRCTVDDVVRPEADHPRAERHERRTAGKYVDLYDFPDRPLELRWKGISLPYRVFSKDHRVSHTAIVENKRLGHALALVKAQQDLKRETKVLTNSQKTGYVKRPRQIYGPNFMEKPLAPKAVAKKKRK